MTNFDPNFYLFQIFKMGDEEDRKLFVGGLPQEASQDDLQVKFYFLYGLQVNKSFFPGILWEVRRVRLGQT